MASPLRFQRHAEPHSKLVIWLGNYQIATPGIMVGIEPTILLDQDNEPQPDGVLFIEPDRGDNADSPPMTIIAGAPELIAEVAASSAAYDLHDKKRLTDAMV